MAHPKRRQSNTRTAKRRTHDQYVLTVAHIMYIIQYVPHAATIVARLPL